MTIVIERGLPDRFRLAASILYFTAFWPKLSRILGEHRKADVAAAAAPRLRPERAVVAYSGDRLLGIAAFKQNGEGLVGLGLSDLRAVFGVWGGLWRGLAMSILERTEGKGALLMDGICVDETARGAGIGSRLLDAIEEEARRSGAQSVRLDVIDINPRARALYQKRGFLAVKTRRLGLLAPVFGFSEATEMHKYIERDR